MSKNILEELRMTILPQQTVSNDIDCRPIEEFMLAPTEDVEVHDIEGEAIEISFEVGARKKISAISWTCSTNRGNRLNYNGQPFIARNLVYYVDNISWQAGGGWPVYTSYCPQPNYSTSMRYRDAKRHQIVPVFGGYYWLGCNNHASGYGYKHTEVWFWVNDDQYKDNAGSFHLTVTSYS